MTRATIGAVESAAAEQPVPVGRFLGLCLVDFTARISYNIARTPVLPLFAAALGANEALIGLIVAISTVTGIFVKAPAGAFSDHFGRGRTLLIGAAVFALTPFFYIFVAYAAMLVAIRLFHGLATAIYGPVANATAAELAGRRRGEFLAWFSLIKIATNAIGGVIGAAILFWLGGDQPTIGDFHKAYGICGLFGLVGLVAALMLLPRIDRPRPEQKRSARQALAKLWSGLAETITNLRVLITSGCESVQNMTMGILQAFLPIYVVYQAKLSIMDAGLLWGIITGTSVVAKPLMGRLSDRYGRRWVIAAGMILCALPFAAMPLFRSFGILSMLGVVFGLGEAFVTSSTTALVSELCQQRSLGAALGVFGTLADTGQAIGPIVAGLLLASIGYVTAFAAVSVLLVLWTVLFVLLVRPAAD
ncbi:MAG: MFS transporter [Phycisphaerae bacterium]